MTAAASRRAEPGARRELVPVGRFGVLGTELSAVLDPGTGRVTICAGTTATSPASWLGGVQIVRGDALELGRRLRAELTRRRIPALAFIERLRALLGARGLVRCAACGSQVHGSQAHRDPRAAELAAEQHRRAGDAVGAELFRSVAANLRGRIARELQGEERDRRGEQRDAEALRDRGERGARGGAPMRLEVAIPAVLERAEDCNG